MIIANALDNAIEGVLRSTGIDRTVLLDITSKSDYISILIENYASGPIYEDLWTSKPDNKNHGFDYMITQISKSISSISSLFVAHGIIPENDRDVYVYSLEVFLSFFV
jgi:hypothetical protein